MSEDQGDALDKAFINAMRDGSSFIRVKFTGNSFEFDCPPLDFIIANIKHIKENTVD